MQAKKVEYSYFSHWGSSERLCLARIDIKSCGVIKNEGPELPGPPAMVDRYSLGATEQSA